MAQSSSTPLKPNPFTTERDPQTGQWLVVKTASRSAM